LKSKEKWRSLHYVKKKWWLCAPDLASQERCQATFTVSAVKSPAPERLHGYSKFTK
jgi:hypothetical protein